MLKTKNYYLEAIIQLPTLALKIFFTHTSSKKSLFQIEKYFDEESNHFKKNVLINQKHLHDTKQTEKIAPSNIL